MVVNLKCADTKYEEQQGITLELKTPNPNLKCDRLRVELRDREQNRSEPIHRHLIEQLLNGTYTIAPSITNRCLEYLTIANR